MEGAIVLGEDLGADVVHGGPADAHTASRLPAWTHGGPEGQPEGKAAPSLLQLAEAHAADAGDGRDRRRGHAHHGAALLQLLRYLGRVAEGARVRHQLRDHGPGPPALIAVAANEGVLAQDLDDCVRGRGNLRALARASAAVRRGQLEDLDVEAEERTQGLRGGALGEVARDPAVHRRHGMELGGRPRPEVADEDEEAVCGRGPGHLRRSAALRGTHIHGRQLRLAAAQPLHQHCALR
mmetsp:Transcript_16986/g.53544  ORF Transcript_16986/g.53544 Transcript_16986/m.53544 type:complete len:238 (+) Transcript_16986:1182-1895(+)